MNEEPGEITTTATRAPDRRSGLIRYLKLSEMTFPRRVRALHRWIRSLSIPAPRLVVRPLLWAFLAWRSCYYFGLRVLVCEPFFKAHCKQYGRGLRTGVYLHWVQGVGDIIVGDGVRIDGKCVITFAARFADRPALTIGNNVGIAHDCWFTIGKRIEIGDNCRLSSGVRIFDSNGHPTDPAARWAGQPPSTDDVRPVVIGAGVWIGLNSLIFPGVKIGEGSVVSAGSAVRGHVPPFSVVGGNPAQVIFRLRRPTNNA